MNENTRPLMVTIQCIAFNHEPYIRQCLDGFVMQKTNFRFEAIVHDDASTDGTAAIVREYAEKYPDIIKPIFETENLYSKGGGFGLLQKIMDAHTHGKYVAFCEGDDYWTDPLKLQKQFDRLENHLECSICFCKVNTINKDGRLQKGTIPQNNASLPEIVTLNDFMHNEFCLGHWTFHTSSFFMRREIVDKFDNNMTHVFHNFPYGDMPLLLTGLLNGDGVYIDEAMGVYRMFSGGYNSFLLAHPENAIRDEKKLIQAMHDLDEYTKMKYHDKIYCRIRRGELKIKKLSGDFRGLFERKYFPIYKMLGLKYTISTFLYTLSPRVFHYLKALYNGHFYDIQSGSSSQ